jgi:RNA polymerase sigma factor (sigma-70 family)
MSAEPLKVTVFVVDDDPAVRDSIQRVLSSTGWSIETYASAQEFLDLHDRAKVGCLLLDMRLAGMSGSELQEHLRAEGSRLPIVFLTAYGDVPTAVRAMKNGAFEFLEKPLRAHALIEVLSRAIDAHTQARQREHQQQDVRRRTAELSRREREVFEFLVRGTPVKTIARELGVDPKTVHTHRARVLEKLGVASTVELALMFASWNDPTDNQSPPAPIAS